MNGAATATPLDAALDSARRGWPVFPCHTPTRGGCSCRDAERCSDIGKHPRTEHGLKDATTDEATIRQWWRRWPDANIGIPTGTASGFFVADVDPRHGGDDTLAELEKLHGPLPATVESLTGGGGRHILFRYPGYPVKTGTGTLGPGLDIRGDGGYIVAPLSLHASGRRYTWEASSHPDETPIAEATAWLLEKLRPEATNGNGRGFTVGEKIKDGERNATLYRMARSLKAKGLSKAAILAALRSENQAKCEPPLLDVEIEKIVAHAFEQPDRPEFAAPGAADRQESPNGEARAVITRLSEVKPEKVTWLWRGRIPLGKLTVVEGDPGLGKSTMTTDLAARVSTGAPMPDGAPTEPGGVVVLSLEDGLADTIVPRLIIAGADLTRCISLDAVKQGGKDRLPTIEDIGAIREACDTVQARLVILDPLVGYLASNKNSWRDQDMRSALGPLAKLAEELSVAVLLVRHLNKATGGQAIYRGGGSIGIVGAARSAFLIAKDPENEERRILAVVKTNLAKTPPSLSFHVESVGDHSRIVWGGISAHTADALLAVPSSLEDRSALEEAKDFLQELLGSGPVEAKEIQRQARAIGIADKTLHRAKNSLGVLAQKEGMQGGWRWKLAEDGQEVPKMANIYDDHLRESLTTFADEEVCIL